MSDEVIVWLSVWCEIASADATAVPKTHHLLLHLNPDQFLQHDAMLVLYMLSSCVCLFLCLTVRLLVTSRYCVKTAKRRIMQTTPHDSLGTLVF